MGCSIPWPIGGGYNVPGNCDQSRAIRWLLIFDGSGNVVDKCMSAYITAVSGGASGGNRVDCYTNYTAGSPTSFSGSGSVSPYRDLCLPQNNGSPYWPFWFDGIAPNVTPTKSLGPNFSLPAWNHSAKCP